MLYERAYAKINLTLDVLGKRPDGYHEVNMVMQTVDLSDLIWVEETSKSSSISIECNVSHIPCDQRNLAYMAANAFMQQTGIQRGVRIRIEKQIPVAAGLAGGSADAAAVLRAMNRLFDTKLQNDALEGIAGTIGSDVPFCVSGGCSIATGRGERLEPVAHRFSPWVILVKPPVFVSTADVYRNLSKADYAEVPASDAMVRYLQAQDYTLVLETITNSLRPVTQRLYPQVESLAKRVEHVTGLPVFMSGSGPTLYCLVGTKHHGQRVYNALRGFAKEVYLCRLRGSKR